MRGPKKSKSQFPPRVYVLTVAKFNDALVVPHEKGERGGDEKRGKSAQKTGYGTRKKQCFFSPTTRLLLVDTRLTTVSMIQDTILQSRTIRVLSDN